MNTFAFILTTFIIISIWYIPLEFLIEYKFGNNSKKFDKRVDRKELKSYNIIKVKK